MMGRPTHGVMLDADLDRRICSDILAVDAKAWTID